MNVIKKFTHVTVYLNYRNRIFHFEKNRSIGFVILWIINEFDPANTKIGIDGVDILELDWNDKIKKFADDGKLNMIVEKNCDDLKYKLKMSQMAITKECQYNWLIKLLKSDDYLI